MATEAQDGSVETCRMEGCGRPATKYVTVVVPDSVDGLEIIDEDSREHLVGLCEGDYETVVGDQTKHLSLAEKIIGRTPAPPPAQRSAAVPVDPPPGLSHEEMRATHTMAPLPEPPKPPKPREPASTTGTDPVPADSPTGTPSRRTWHPGETSEPPDAVDPEDPDLGPLPGTEET